MLILQRVTAALGKADIHQQLREHFHPAAQVMQAHVVADHRRDHLQAGDNAAALGKRGRVLLRKSGTEPLIRVMVEGEHEDQVHEFAHRIAEAVKSV